MDPSPGGSPVIPPGGSPVIPPGGSPVIPPGGSPAECSHIGPRSKFAFIVLLAGIVLQSRSHRQAACLAAAVSRDCATAVLAAIGRPVSRSRRIHRPHGPRSTTMIMI